MLMPNDDLQRRLQAMMQPSPFMNPMALMGAAILANNRPGASAAQAIGAGLLQGMGLYQRQRAAALQTALALERIRQQQELMKMREREFGLRQQEFGLRQREFEQKQELNKRRLDLEQQRLDSLSRYYNAMAKRMEEGSDTKYAFQQRIEELTKAGLDPEYAKALALGAVRVRTDPITGAVYVIDLMNRRVIAQKPPGQPEFQWMQKPQPAGDILGKTEDLHAPEQGIVQGQPTADATGAAFPVGEAARIVGKTAFNLPGIMYSLGQKLYKSFPGSKPSAPPPEDMLKEVPEGYRVKDTETGAIWEKRQGQWIRIR